MKGSKNLQLHDIEKSFGPDALFSDVSITLAPGDKVAIIGDNGAGKSTLMRIMAGLDDFDEGKVLCPDWITRTYVAQDYQGDPNTNAQDLFATQGKPAKAFAYATELGLDLTKNIELAQKPLHQLSGGQKRIVELAAALSLAPAFLFIDEPENHLDIVARSRLTEILLRFRGCVCVVSHDRFLVNQLSQKIVEVAGGTTRVVSGMNYEEYRDMQKRELAGAQRQWNSEKKAVDKLEKAVHILKKQAFRGTNTATYQRRKRELEERKTALQTDKPGTNKRLMRPQTIKVANRSGKLIVECEKASIQYPGAQQPLIADITMDVRFGDKRVILGRNGAGKSSLINLLLGKIKPASGKVTFGKDIAIELFEQTHELDPTKTPLDIISNKTGLLESQARAILGRYAFSKDLMDTKVAKLSGGQKARLRFALTFTSQPEFLILDEPTNNLDPSTWEVLTEHVINYPGTIIIISHDRAFIEAVNPEILWVIDNKKVSESTKDIDEILRKMIKAT